MRSSSCGHTRSLHRMCRSNPSGPLYRRDWRARPLWRLLNSNPVQTSGWILLLISFISRHPFGSGEERFGFRSSRMWNEWFR
jgi:hypothetical protein